MSTDKSSLGAIVGGNVRRVREERGWTRKELVARLWANGLGWREHQVTAIELGRREGIDLAEFVLLLHVLEVPARALLCSPHDGVTPEIQLTPDAAMLCDNIVTMLSSATFERVEMWLSDIAGLAWISLEADEGLAERLGVDTGVVLEAAERLWGHSMTIERNRRVEALGDDAGDRRAIRGHVTRELSAELEQEIRTTKEDP